MDNIELKYVYFFGNFLSNLYIDFLGGVIKTNVYLLKLNTQYLISYGKYTLIIKLKYQLKVRTLSIEGLGQVQFNMDLLLILNLTFWFAFELG